MKRLAFWRAPPPPPPPPPPPASALSTPSLATVAVLGSSLPFFLFVALFLLDYLLFKPMRLAAKKSRTLGNVRFSPSKLPERIDTIVIGSGQGGLSCASVLSQFGESVVVLEQHEVTGGGAHCFAVDGKSKWRFDAGHHITIPWHEQVLHLACGTVGIPVPFDKTMDRTVDGFSDRIALGEAPSGEEALPIRDDAQLTAELIKRFPQHKANIIRYMQLADSVQMRFGILTAASILPMRFRLMLLHCSFMLLWREWAGRTAADGLRAVFPGDDAATNKLRSYLSGLWLDAGSPPSRGSFFMQTAVMGGWQKLGVSYPRGGPQNTALAMVECIEARGGAVFVRAPVESVLLDKLSGEAVGVRMTSGLELKATRVVSSLGYRATEKLLTPQHPAAPKLATPQSAGFVMANVGLRGTARELGISSANLWLQPANASNNYDALKGEVTYFASPLEVDLSLVPVGITFPSAKELTRDEITAEDAMGATSPLNVSHSDAGAENAGPYHTCQILALAEYAPIPRMTFPLSMPIP